LRKTLTIDEDKRMGWDEIYKHQILDPNVKLSAGKPP
jgi:hypothetical protein